MKAKKDLIRIVRSPVDGVIAVDLHGKSKGRGTYICPNLDCINLAMQTERLSRAFRTSSESPDRVSLEVVNELKQNLLELTKA